MEEETLRIRRFEEIPTAEEFTSQIESKNVPAVIITIEILNSSPWFTDTVRPSIMDN